MVQRIGFGGNTIEFPDEFSQEQIDQIIKQRAPEYRKMFGIPEPEAPSYASDLYQFAKKGAGSGISGLGWLGEKTTGYGSSLQEYGGEMAKAAEAEISPLAKERASRNYLEEAAPGEGMFGYKPNFAALAGAPYQIAESLPGSLAGMGAAAAATALAPVGLLGGAGAAGIAALRVLGPLGTKLATSALGRAGTAAAVATGKDVFEAAAPAVGKMVFATLAGSTTEGLQAAGMSGEEIEKTITQYLTEDPSALNKTEIGKAALAQANGNVEEAIKIAASESAGKAAIQTGFSTAALSLPGSIFEAGIITGAAKRGAVRQAITGGLTEGVLQEMPQSAAEQYIQNVAQGAYDPSVTPGQGVLEAAIKGGIAGFGMGAGLGGVSSAVQGAEPSVEEVDRMGRRVGQEELGLALEDVRRQDIDHVDMLKAQGVEDDQIIASYPHLADELANRRATEAAAAQQEADDFAANRDQISEGGPSFGDFSARNAGLPVDESIPVEEDTTVVDQFSPEEAFASEATPEEDFSTRSSSPSLPKTLAGAKPKYGFKSNNFQLNFESDLGKALYIAEGKDANNAYRKWLINKAGIPEENIDTLGQQIKDQIKTISGSQPAGVPISVTNSFFGEPSANAPQAAAPATQLEIGQEAPIDEAAFEEELSPTTAPEDAAGAALEPLDPARLRRSHDIVGKFLNEIAARGPSGKTQAATAARQIADGTLSSPEVHHALIANDIVSRILGGTQADPDTGFFKDLTRGYDARRIGAGKPGGGLRGLIEFSLNPGSLSYMRETAYHEPFHILQDLMQQYDPKTAQLVAGKFSDGMTLDQIDPSIRRTLQMAAPEKGGPTYWDKFSEQYQAATPAGETLRSEFGKAREAQAYMFGMLADAKMQGHNMNGLTPAFKRFLNFLAQVRQRMGNYLRGQGYRSVQDVFHDYASGKGQQGYGAEVSGAAPESEEFSFIGQGAKQWPKDVQDKAEELEEQGADAERVWMETGMHRGLRDRKWRYEVPDVYAKFDPDGLKLLAGRQTVDLKDLLLHPEFFSNYPSFMASKITASKSILPGEASFLRHRGVNYIELSLEDAKALNSGGSNDMMQSLLHEIQHGIQESEGFAKGTNTGSGTIKEVAERVENAARNTLDDAKDLAAKAVREAAAKRLGQNLYETNMDDWRSEVKDAIDEVERRYGVSIIDEGFFAPKINIVRLGAYLPSALKEAEKNGIGFYVRQTPSDDNGWKHFRAVTKDEKDAVMAELLSDPDLKAASEIFGALRVMQKDLDAKIAAWKKEYNKEQKSLAETMKKLKQPAAAPTYRGEPGERESRDTELRSKLLTPEERRAQLPGALMPYKGFKAEGSLNDIINKPGYARDALAKIKEAISKSVPKPEEFEVLSDYVDEFSKRGGAVAPQTAQQAWNEAPIIDPYSLVGEHVVPLIADLAEADGHFTGIDSSQFADKAEGRYGGPGYPFMYNSKQHDLGWAFATQGAVNTILNKTYDEPVVDRNGKPVLDENGNQRVEKRPVKYAVVLAMTPDTHRSNNSFARSLLKNIDAYVRDGRITPAQIEALNLIAKSGAKGKAEDVDLSDFPGFKSGKALSYMENTSFEKRVELAKRMSSKAAAENGIPNVDRIARALISKDHAGTPYYHGILLIELPTGADRRPIDLAKEGLPIHPSYKFAIKGKVVGKFATTVNNEILWKDWFADKREEAKTKVTPKGQPPNVRRAFEMAKPSTLITKEIADLIPSRPIDIQSAKAAELAVNIALDKWTSSDDPVKDGGVKPAEFISALMASDAHSSLTDYGWIPAVEEKDGTISAEGFKTDPVKNLTGMVKRGDIKLFKLQGSETYFAVKNEGNGRKSLVSVINNEPGARGVGGPAVVLKAIQEGVTDLDCYAVPSAKYPDGFLNEFYSKFGFEETDSYPFDEKYVKDPSFGGSETKYNDLLHFWRESGWDESMGFPKLSIMEWRGSNAFRENPVRGYLAKSREASRPEGNSADVAGAAGELQPISEQVGGEGEAGVERADTRGLRNGRPVRNADTFVRTLVNSLRLTENEARVFGLPPERVAQAKEAVPEVDEFSKRGGDPVFVRTYKELRESARSRADWRDWYDRHDQLLRDTFGDDAELFQSILSATSQAASVAANVGLALKAYRQLKSNANQFEGFLPAVIKNLDRIRANEALRGAKISEYGKASAGDETGIAVDRHIAMIMFGKKAPNAREIAIAKEWIRDIAKDLGWKPREVQAALWAANQVIQGKDPADVRSYDYFLDKKASQIAALRSAFPDTGGTAAGVRESGTAIQSGEERSQRGGVEEGEKAIGRALQNAGANAVTTGGKIKRFLKSTFDPLAELPEREQYLLMRYSLLGKTDALEDEAKGFYEIIKKATDLQKKQIYAYLTTRGAVAPVLPPELRATVLQVKTRINQIGNELVNRRIISPQSLAVYKDKYLPRLYMKYLLEERGIADTGIRVGNQQYKLQRNQKLSVEDRIAMGEVVDPGFLSFAALYRPARDMAVLDFLSKVANSSGTDWVMPDQLINWKGTKVTAFWMSDEAKNIRERMLYEPDARKKAVMERVANQMQALSDPLLNQLATDNYKRLPTSSRYGALKGLAVRKEIYDDLIAAGGFDPDPNFIDKIFGDKNSSLARGTQFWKMTKTILNPPTQVRNFVSNAVMLNLSGVPLHMVPKRMMQAFDAMRNNGLAWQVAKQYGVRAGGFNENELRDAQQVLREYLSQNTTGFMNPRHITNFLASLTDKAGNAYQLTEMLFKTAKIVDEIERKGLANMPAGAARDKALGRAALEGHKWFFDYSLVPRGIKSLRTMPFGAPFITYYYKALPLIIEVATNPKTAMRFAPYVALQAALPILVASMEDVDEDDVDKLKMAMSEQLREKPSMLIIPFRDQLNRWQFLDAGYFFPWSMFLSTALSVSKGDVSGALGSVGALSSPALSAAAAIKTNIDPFTGREIVNPLDTPKEQMYSLLHYVNGLISPPILTQYGALGKAIDAATNTGMNKYGEPNMTATQIGLRAFGINVTPLVPEMQRARNINHMNSEYQRVLSLRNLRLRDQSLTDSDRAAVAKDFDADLAKRYKKIEDYVNASDFPVKLQTNK